MSGENMIQMVLDSFFLCPVNYVPAQTYNFNFLLDEIVICEKAICTDEM